MSLNDNIVDIEKPDGILLPTFVADGFSGLFFHSSLFSIIFDMCINNKWCFIRLLVLIKL